MAAHLDLIPAAPTRPAIRWAFGAAGLIVLLAVVGALAGIAGLVLAGCVVAGAGLTHLCGLGLTVEERLAYGAVIGAVALGAVTLPLAAAFGLAPPTVAAAGALVLGAGTAAWWPERARTAAELADLGARWRSLRPWPLWLLLAVAWPYTLDLLGHAYRETAAGLVAGNPGVYADWAAHLTYAGSFAYAGNLPPEFPIDPGHRMAYPFMIDFLAAALVQAGASLPSSLVLTSGLLGLAFPAVMYLGGLRLSGSAGGSALAVLIFVAGGGLGFTALVRDLDLWGGGALLHLPRLYTQDIEHNYQWLNPVLAWLLPQRSVLFGFALAVLVMALLWTAREGTGRRPFVFAGLLAGLTPLFHLHAWGAMVMLAAFWSLLNPRREWIGFFLPALGLGVPAALWMATAGAAQPRFQLWWLADTAGHHDGPLWFWLKNTGILIPVMLAGWLWRGLLPARLALHLAPAWLWFAIPNFWVLQPWDWDNTKFFAYWALFGALPAGCLIARLAARRVEGAIAAGLLTLVLVAAGGLDLARALDPSVSSALFTDRGGLETAAWVRGHTDRRAVFLVAPEHNQPVPSLSARRVVAGYGGWLWTYGLADWAERTNDAERMLRGEPGTAELVARYQVSYVVLGPQELNGHRANASYWADRGEVVHASGGYTVYRLA